MILSREWLSDYTNIEVSDKEFCDGMTMSGSKVETVYNTVRDGFFNHGDSNAGYITFLADKNFKQVFTANVEIKSEPN